MITVVKTAMTTRMVNSSWSSTPKLSPTLRMTSSVRPRVFISTPSATALRARTPCSRAAEAAPTNFPTQATTSTAPSSSRL